MAAEIIRLCILLGGARPRPREGLLTLSEVAEHRHLVCEGYHKCLTFAVRAKWGGFTCTSCRYFEADAA